MKTVLESKLIHIASFKEAHIVVRMKDGLFFRFKK